MIGPELKLQQRPAAIAHVPIVVCHPALINNYLPASQCIRSAALREMTSNLGSRCSWYPVRPNPRTVQDHGPWPGQEAQGARP